MKLKWLKQPEEHDYPAAAAYLSLIFGDKTVSELIAKLKKAPVTIHKAKDILRASQLPALGITNFHVKADTKK